MMPLIFLMKFEENWGSDQIRQLQETDEFEMLSKLQTNHSIEYKRRVIIGQLDRILFLTYPEYHKKNIESMISVLLSNILWT